MKARAKGVRMYRRLVFSYGTVNQVRAVWQRQVLMVAGPAAVLAMAACLPEPTFVCEDDDECSDGVCEANGYCSFEDDDCSSGQRFSEYAGDGLANVCVPVGCDGDEILDAVTGNCVAILEGRLTWEEARQQCLARGETWDLLAVDSAREQEFVLRLLDSNDSYWLGGSDAAEEGRWLWPDGAGVPGELWAPDQPDGGTAENCLSMDGGGAVSDERCEASQNAVCEEER